MYYNCFNVTHSFTSLKIFFYISNIPFFSLWKLEGLNSRREGRNQCQSPSFCNQRFPNYEFRTCPPPPLENCYKIKFPENLIGLRTRGAKQFLTYSETFPYQN